METTIIQKRTELAEIGYLVARMNDQEIEKFYPNVEKSKRPIHEAERQAIAKTLKRFISKKK